jgi:hypothetical protein
MNADNATPNGTAIAPASSLPIAPVYVTPPSVLALLASKPATCRPSTFQERCESWIIVALSCAQVAS